MRNLEKPKKSIDNILKSQAYNKQEQTAEWLKEEISKWLEQGKITNEEYDTLNTYVEIRLTQLLNKENEETIEQEQTGKEEVTKNKAAVTQEEIKQQFRDRMQVETKELKYTPIYQGKANKLPPKRKTKEERE